MAGALKKRLSLSEYRVAIICPLEVEMSAMRYMLDEEHVRLPRVEGDLNSYVFGELGGHNVVIGFLPYGDQGIGAAATVATHMKRTFPSITLRLLVGLAGGIPSQTNDIRLGDVVISMPDGVYGGVVQYDLGKETIDGFERKGSLEPPPKEWRDAVLLMLSDHRVSGNQISNYITEMTTRYTQLSAYRYPEQSHDRLFVSDYVHASGQGKCDSCDLGRLVSRRPRRATGPAVFSGLIASGDRVIKNGKVRDKISQQTGGALCFEMEAAGLMNEFRCLVIRGICDYADSHKNDEWHAYGAAVAAGCAKEILTYIEPHKNVPDPTHPAIHKNHFIVPKQTVKDFVGRDPELGKIEAYFTATSHDRVRAIVIHALGGQGKSQLALECCYRSRNEYRGIFWINASSTSSAHQSLSEIAQELDETHSLQGCDEDTKVRFVLRELSQWKDRWLMVYDNCDDPNNFNAIRDLIPNVGRGDVLLTSRHRGLEQLGMLLDLPPMPVPAGVSLLLSGYSNIDVRKYMDIGTKIVNRLGGLALAIKQAAAYIQYRELPIEALGDFLGLYESQRNVILQHTPDTLWEYGALHATGDTREKAINAFTTWEMSLQFLCPNDPNRQRAMLHVLSLVAFLAPTPINESIFEAYLMTVQDLPSWAWIFLDMDSDIYESNDGYDRSFSAPPSYPPRNSNSIRRWSQEKFWNFVHTTKKHCLTQGTAGGYQPGTVEFSLHPLIRDWLQLRNKRQGLSRYVTEAIVMVAHFIRATQGSASQRKAERSLLAHTSTIMELDLEHNREGERIGDRLNNLQTAQTLVKFFSQLGRYDSELELRQRIHSSYLRELGPDNYNTQETAYGVAWTLYCKGQFDRALRIFRENVKDRKRVLGVHHPKTITSLAAVCDVLVHLADFQPVLMEEALVVTKELLALDYAVLPKYDLNRLRTMRGSARLLTLRGKNEAARAMYIEVLALARESRGPRNELTILVLHNFSAFLVETGRTEEAEPGIKELVTLYEEFYGVNHPRTLLGQELLARALKQRRNYAAAVEKYEMILYEYREQGLDGTLESMFALLGLASAMEGQKRYDDAANLMRKGITICYRAYGGSSAMTKKYSGILVTIMRHQGMDDPSIIKAIGELVTSLGMPKNEVKPFVNEVMETAAYLYGQLRKQDTLEPSPRVIRGSSPQQNSGTSSRASTSQEGTYPSRSRIRTPSPVFELAPRGRSPREWSPREYTRSPRQGKLREAWQKLSISWRSDKGY